MSSVRKKAGVVKLRCVIERKDQRLPRYMVVPARLLEAWKLEGTTVVEATVNGVDIGRRTLKKWDDDRWFVELSQPMCDRARVDTGDRVELSLRLASDELPPELAALLADNRRAQTAWAKLTPGQQRMLREDVFAAKSSEARRRRAERRCLDRQGRVDGLRSWTSASTLCPSQLRRSRPLGRRRSTP